MNSKPLKKARDADLRFSEAAMQRAARRAHELAARSGTAIVIGHDGIVELVEPETLGTPTDRQGPRMPGATGSQ